MKISGRSVMAGEMLPRGYRIAYFDYPAFTAHAYPIGIHLLVMALRRLWEATYWYRSSRLERFVQEHVETAVRQARSEWERDRELAEQRAIDRLMVYCREGEGKRGSQ